MADYSFRNKSDAIIEDIRLLVKTKGFIYAFCMVLFEDFHVYAEKLHKVDSMKNLSIKEATLLLGLLVQNEIDFSKPQEPMDIIKLKRKIYELMEELHASLEIPFFDKLEQSLLHKSDKKDMRLERKKFFGDGNLLLEPVFYSGAGVYDFQYLDFLERKYKYDKDWLRDKQNFDLYATKKNVLAIKEVLDEKSKRVALYDLKDEIPKIIEKYKRENQIVDSAQSTDNFLRILEFYQYVQLFVDDDGKIIDISNMKEIKETGWNSFYKNLIDLFVVRRSDLNPALSVEPFLRNFSLVIKKDTNSQFKKIGDRNIINSHPIIQLNDDRYFVPIMFLLFEAVYESPFYWMNTDVEYFSTASKNRGVVGEEIAYEFLLHVFGKRSTYKSVKIKSSKRGKDQTDIDVLCLLGSKALCLQVKSKKLTQLSKTGDDIQLQKDFQRAVQDAYKQNLKCRDKILGKECLFLDETGKRIILPEKINEVYLMCVTTENYPALTHQTHSLLDKNNEDPFPLVLTVFDLELLVHYLSDPFDFLYYVRQRISLMEFFVADEEIIFLGYHLHQKLHKIPNFELAPLDKYFGSIVDRNYYPLKAKLKISSEGDILKDKWKNEKFDILCSELKDIDSPKITDVLFQLFDLSGDARESLVNYITTTKQKTMSDNNSHNFTIPPDERFLPLSGITYLSSNSNDKYTLAENLLYLCDIRKYKCKGVIWVGFGSVKDSDKMIDLVVFNDHPWKYDRRLEKESKNLSTPIELKKVNVQNDRVSRNDQCPCGSGLKYKKCCGRS
jgi:hypothetical protein